MKRGGVGAGVEAPVADPNDTRTGEGRGNKAAESSRAARHGREMSRLDGKERLRGLDMLSLRERQEGSAMQDRMAAN